MLDYKFIKDNLAAVKENIKKKGMIVNLADVKNDFTYILQEWSRRRQPLVCRKPHRLP